MNTYLLFKSLHLIAVISWMAGLLYLPRIFVYHAENNSEIKTSEIFKVMEKKLFFYIMTPAMFLSWLFGLRARLFIDMNKTTKSYKGNFWDSETQSFYKWDELQELHETRRLYRLMQAEIERDYSAAEDPVTISK